MQGEEPVQFQSGSSLFTFGMTFAYLHNLFITAGLHQIDEGVFRAEMADGAPSKFLFIVGFAAERVFRIISPNSPLAEEFMGDRTWRAISSTS